MEQLQLEGEIWKDIPNYEGLYQASNFSRFRGVDRIVDIKRKSGIYKRPIKAQILKMHRSVIGYSMVFLCNGNTGKLHYAHRILAELFIPNPENKPQVNHINGIKTDFYISNLEWVTDSENKKHAYKTGLIKIRKGYDNSTSKTVYRYDLNGNLIGVYPNTIEAAKSIGVLPSRISRACLNKNFTCYKNIWRYKQIEENAYKS